MPINIVLAISHSTFVKGDLTNFKIEPSFGVEASELYPDVKYTTVDEYLNVFVWEIQTSPKQNNRSSFDWRFGVEVCLISSSCSDEVLTIMSH